ncbi:MAG: Gfo/Idh/MocA family oxidoreductase [Opitutaceae bacterium]
MSQFTRRTFIKNTAVIGTAAAFSARSWAQVAGANGDIRVAVIGLNGRGKNHLSSLAKVEGVRVVALCDPDTAVLEKVKPTVNGGEVKTFVDVRELLASRDIDAVTIATPNHWHSLGAIWAMQAGKDVYVEKPVSHNVWEGRQLVAAAAKYQRVVQCGTQIRSGEAMQEAVAFVRAGNLGKITAARGFCYKPRASIGKTSGPQPIPASINYDLWTGPAPLTPPRRNSPEKGPIHYDWHWINAYGNGDIGNQGIHQMDVARWFLGESGLPRHTLSVGGRLGYEDDGETPNTQAIVHDYATAPLIFEVRGLPSVTGGREMDKYRGVSVGNVIDCEGGYVSTNSYFAATAFDRDGKVVKEFKGTDRQMQNFIDVIRSRKIAQLYGPVKEGHISSALCHVGNISHLIGKTAAPGVILEKVKGNAMMAEAYGRMTEHLKANGVDLSKTPATLGMPLALDPAKERFIGEGAAVANALLTRQYRAPYVVPNLTGVA